MDDITIDENYDEMKEEFFKGLTFRQAVYAAATVCCGAAVYAFFTLFVHLPNMLTLYLTVLLALPVGANGFMSIYGMTILEFLKRYRAVKQHPGYVYISEESPDMEEKDGPKERKKSGKTPARSPLCLYMDSSGSLVEPDEGNGGSQ